MHRLLASCVRNGSGLFRLPSSARLGTTSICQRPETTSEESAGQPEADQDLRKRLLDTALLRVPHDGWTREALRNAAADLGLSSAVHGLAARGGIELVYHHLDTSLARLVTLLQQQPPPTDASLFMRQACEQRLRMNEPVLHVWPQALALAAQPQHVLESFTWTGRLVDEICWQAGDRSLNVDWYGKRAGLAYALKTSELFMLQDKSADFADTWAFLARRFEEPAAILDAGNQIKSCVGMTGELAYSVGLTMCNILGGNSRRP